MAGYLRSVIVSIALIALVMVSVLPAGAHVATCPSPESANYAKISKTGYNTYKIAGSASCDSWVDLIQIRCWPVHRHTLYWHSHTGAAIEDAAFGQPRVTVGWSNNITGTPGDKYKTHCDMQATHANTVTWSRESGTVTLG